MAIRYIQSGDEAGFLAAGGQIDDGADSWWAGAQRCFAGVAIAAAIAASAFTTDVAQAMQWDPEEIPAGSLKVFSTPDEDYWQNPAQTVCRMPQVADRANPAYDLRPTIYQQLPYLPEVSDDPAGSLTKFSTPDEDFWDNPLSPIATGNYQRLPYQPEPEELPAGSLKAFPSPDEDYWQNPVVRQPTDPARIYQTLPVLPDVSDDPAASLRGQPDEDYWQNPVAPIPASVYQKLPILPDLSDDPAASLRGQPDEDYWQSPVAPIPASVYQKLPILPDLSDDPAGSLHGQPDEDYWQNRVAPIPASVYQKLPILPDLCDDPAGSLYGQPDEDFWANPVVRQLTDSATIYQPLPITAGEPADIIPPLVAFQPDEDFWANPAQTVCRMPQVAGRANPTYDLPPTIYQPLPYLPDLSDDPAGSLLKFVSPDEDYWQNLTAPAPPNLCQALPYASGETAEIPPQTVLPPDEDFWQNPVAPAPPCGPKPSGLPSGAFAQPGGGPPALYGQLPYLPDLSDDPAGSLAKFSSPEEDFWDNPVAPFAPSLYQPLPIAAGEPDFIPAAVFPPEEDHWRNSVAPVPPTVYQRLPYLPEISDEPAGSLYGVPEETEWQNRVAPIAASVFPSLPYSFDAAEILLPPAFTPEEDCWQNPIIPAHPSADGWMQPAVYGFDEFSSYWWTRHLTGWAVRTHSPARKRASRSTARRRISRGVSRQSSI